MTKTDREKTKERVQGFTNLYIEKLPYAFEEKDLVELFSKYGTVLSVKIKKPNSNVPIQNINHLPCSAYVNFGSED